MSAAAVAALQRQAAEAEVERLRLVGELEEMRERAERAEARLADISGMERQELVAREENKRLDLLAALDDLEVVVSMDFGPNRQENLSAKAAAARAAIAKARGGK